jgi:protein-S-isoprenylcysteine O-methyltransferase Ste14
MILSPRLYSDRVYAEAGGAANALEIHLGNGQMEAIGNQSREPIDRRRLVISTTASMLIFVLCLFLPAGTWAWSRGWLFLVVFTAASLLSTLYLRRVNPDVIAGRVNRHGRPRRWDLLLGLLGFLPTMLAIPIVAALDDGRFHWSHLPWWGCLAGYVLMIAGFAGVTWASSVNKFFEPSVRIQTDRGHRVIDTGPYRIVRHPGYALSYPLFLGMPLALGSLWALIPAFFFGLLLIVRTVLEDRTLQNELPGYEEYAQRVTYRLIPGVW